jgi:formylglycine-generating enzyme required for sulfatase activity
MLRGATYYTLNTEEGYEALYRRFTNQPLIQKPELGRIRSRPPLARKQPIHEKPWSDVILGSAFEPEMILIPAGEFLMGSDPQQDEHAHISQQPQHRLFLPDYFLAKTPVTNAQYHAFLRVTGREAPEGWDWAYHTPPSGQEDHPVVNVTWYDTRDYCRWLSEATGRVYALPSEAEWEKGARGNDGRFYPWGNQWDATHCNSAESGLGKITSVHAYPHGASPYGVLDMAGNVWEWTRSLWGEYPYPTHQPEQAWRENLKAARTRHRIQRGGAFHSYQWDMRCASRRGDFPYNSAMGIGFRVVVLPAS